VKFLPKLFENNRAWAEQRKLEDPEYFQRLSGTQTPEYLWIGCADSRVPANEIVGLVQASCSFTVSIKELAEWFGLEGGSWVNECLPSRPN
jgi:hypothetical protein